MKKSILQFPVIAAIAASMTLFTSCSSDDGAEAYVPEPVQFSVGVGNKAITRAFETIGDDWTSGTKVLIYTKDADGAHKNLTYVTTGTSASTTINTTPMKYISLEGDGASVDPTKCFYWASGSDAKKIRAWTYGTTTVPATNLKADVAKDVSEAALNTLSYELDGTGGTAQAGKDFLYAYQKYTKSTDAGVAAKSIIFKHQLARVTIKVYSKKNGALCTLGSSDHKIPVTNTFTQPAADTDDGGSASTYNTNGTWAAFDGTTQTDGYITPRQTETNGSNTSDLDSGGAEDTKYTVRNVFDAVVLPGDYNGKYLFVISYDGATYNYVPNTAHAIDIGYHYTYTVKVNDVALEVTAAIQPWTTSDRTATAELQ